MFIAGLNDSKKLSEAKREALYPEILEKAVAVLVNVVSISNIDKENIYHATQEGMEQILRQIRVRPQVALVDAMHPHVEGIETVPIIHGDALSASIAAASSPIRPGTEQRVRQSAAHGRDPPVRRYEDPSPQLRTDPQYEPDPCGGTGQLPV